MTESHQEERSDIQREVADTASEMLVRAREALGLSQSEVADQLRLTTTFIRYIDDGDFHKIPKAAFIKGYLRSYARVVSLDSDEVIRAYERAQQVTTETDDIGGVAEKPVASGNFTGPVVQTGLIGLVVVLIVVAVVWWSFSTGGDGGAPVVTQPVVPESAVPAMPETQSLEEPVGQDDVVSASVAPEDSGSEVIAEAGEAEEIPPAAETTPADETTPAAGVEVESAPEATMTGVTKRANVAIERVRDGDTLYITVRAGGEDEVEFSFSGECWLEIEDGNGEQIYGDLNRAGDVMTVYGIAPFEVLFGRASAATMTYQGKAVNLGPYTTSDETAKVRTARL
jgi:cytoskeleton protein RodZ